MLIYAYMLILQHLQPYGACSPPGTMAGSSTDLQVANEHTVRFSSLLKAWQKRKDRKSNTEFWDYLKPELQYAEVEPGQTPPLGAVPVGVMLVGVGCNKRLSAKNASDTGKNHKNCVKCKQVGFRANLAVGAAQLPKVVAGGCRILAVPLSDFVLSAGLLC
jgi:hypothetical protein